MLIDYLTFIGKFFTGEMAVSDLSVNFYVLFMDHGMTVALSYIAIRSCLSKTCDKSTKISTAILASSYVLSSLYYYFFNFMIDDGFTDFSLHLSYTFLDSLTVLVVIFAHAFYRMRFSFSSNLVCYMALFNSCLQFYVTIVVFMATKGLITSNTIYSALGGLYSIAINISCWGFAAALFAPIKLQQAIERVRILSKRAKAI